MGRCRRDLLDIAFDVPSPRTRRNANEIGRQARFPLSRWLPWRRCSPCPPYASPAGKLAPCSSRHALGLSRRARWLRNSRISFTLSSVSFPIHDKLAFTPQSPRSLPMRSAVALEYFALAVSGSFGDYSYHR